MRSRQHLKTALGITLLALLGACSVQPVSDGAPPRGSNVPPELPPDPEPRPEPRSAYGNGPIYEVYGQPYQVLETSYGYRERGVASWYGSKFHGRPTSSMEPYDMHAMTAAHKTLPLPTYVRVKNLANNRSIIVRVNDRGPFVDDRIIDLSYAAARKLDMVDAGTSLVEVTAISFDAPPADGAAAEALAEDAGADLLEPAASVPATVFLQVGAFGERDNAERRFRHLRESGIDGVFLFEEAGREPPLYRVRIGPVVGVDHYDQLVASLRQLGIDDPHIVTE